MTCFAISKGSNGPHTYNPILNNASPKPTSRQPHRYKHSTSACYKCIARKSHTLAPKHSLIPPPSPTHLRPHLQRRRATQQQDDNNNNNTPPPPPTNQQEDPNLSPPVKAAISFLKAYKAAISPLLPPSCRFIPTCSEYGMDAYRKHGLGKGTVLTAWRLMRCNPFGGKGYDPVKWPPPGLEVALKWWE